MATATPKAAVVTTSSTLSSLSSDDISTPESFHTAVATNIEGSTAASSPVRNAPSPYRAARQLPRELTAQCQIYLEEQIYSSAITLLNTLLFSGSSRRLSSPRPAFVPPASQIALIATLAVHPMHTTRAEGLDQLEVSTQALSYLRNLLAIVGPVNAPIRTAFKFCGDSRRRARRGGYGGTGTEHEYSDDEEEERDGEQEPLRGPLANESSVWVRGDDLWCIVGWAFNCATRFPHRWRSWKIWLEFMVDAMEADWTERLRIDEEAAEQGCLPDSPRSLLESLILSYVNPDSGRRGVQRIVKALMADGSKQSRALFPEVFMLEDRRLRKKDLKRKRDKVDLENNQFGDYYEEESLSSGGSEPPTPPQNTGQRPLTPSEAESVQLRLRFFKLVSRVYWYLEADSSLSDLYGIFSEAIGALSLKMFNIFVSTRDNPLDAECQATLLNLLIEPLLPAPTSSRNPDKVDPECAANNGISVKILQQCYMPYAASSASAEDNARVSLLLENMLFLLWSNGQLVECDDVMKNSLDKGVKARQEKVAAKLAGASKRKTAKTARNAAKEPEDDDARNMLEDSGQRMTLLMDLLMGA